MTGSGRVEIGWLDVEVDVLEIGWQELGVAVLENGWQALEVSIWDDLVLAIESLAILGKFIQNHGQVIWPGQKNSAGVPAN